MQSLFSEWAPVNGRLYLFFFKMCVTFAPLSSFFHTYAESFFTPVLFLFPSEQCIDPDGYTEKSCYICPCTSKWTANNYSKICNWEGGQFPGIPTGCGGIQRLNKKQIHTDID